MFIDAGTLAINIVLTYQLVIQLIHLNITLGICCAVPLTEDIKFKRTKSKEDVMRTLATIIGILTPVSVFAASGATDKVFVSGPLIVFFLGFCAFVVVVQCIPSLIMLYSMVKGLFSVAKEEISVDKK